MTLSITDLPEYDERLWVAEVLPWILPARDRLTYGDEDVIEVRRRYSDDTGGRLAALRPDMTSLFTDKYDGGRLVTTGCYDKTTLIHN